MGQSEVIEFLERPENYRVWFKAEQIIEQSGLGRSQTYRALLKLRRNKDIESATCEGSIYKYRCKHNYNAQTRAMNAIEGDITWR